MLLGQHPDLAGIYNIGGGADGVGLALRRCIAPATWCLSATAQCRQLILRDNCVH
jgi:hypothetical protein